MYQVLAGYLLGGWRKKQWRGRKTQTRPLSELSNIYRAIHQRHNIYIRVKVSAQLTY